MGVFTRFRDIVNANINAMLDKAEDPEKLVRLMIQEMEDTLIEIRASCAAAIAARKRIERAQEEAQSRADRWAERAQAAVDRGREDLAREALLEKRQYTERAEALEDELSQCEVLTEQYKADILQLECKLAKAREKQRVLVQRHIHAQNKKRAQTDIRRVETSEAIMRFDLFQSRVERMEAEADLVNYGRRPTLEEQIESLMGDEEIEEELQRLKSSGAGNAERTSSA